MEDRVVILQKESRALIVTEHYTVNPIMVVFLYFG